MNLGVGVGPELVALATTAASSLVAAMAGDAWTAIRAGVGRLFGRGGPRAEAVALETLDEDAQALTASGVDSGSAARDLSAQWTVRLRDLMRADPGAEAALRELVSQMSSASVSGHGVAAGRDVNISAPGGVAAGTIEGGVHLTNPRVPGVGQA